MSRSQVTIETLMSAETVGIDDTHYTSSRKFHDCAGDAAILLTVTGAHADCDVTQQCSMNNVDWYTPITAPLGAANTLVITGIDHDATPAYISFDPIPCPYTRFIVHMDVAAAEVTLTLIYRLEV